MTTAVLLTAVLYLNINVVLFIMNIRTYLGVVWAGLC